MKSLLFTNADQSTNSLTIFEKTPQSNQPIILICPAMGVNASYYQKLGEALAERNYTAITLDLRGNGTSSIRPSRKVNFSYEDLINIDYVTAIRTIKKRFPKRKLFLLGHSLGGQLGCLYASKYPNQLDGLILIACCSVYYQSWKGAAKYRTWFGTQFLNIIAHIFGYLPGKQVGFGGLEAKGVIKDWSRQARTGRYELDDDAFNYENAMKQCQIPILAISFEQDTLAPKSAVEHLLQKFLNAPKTYHYLTTDDHRNDNYSHFNWAKKTANIVAMIDAYLQSHTS